MVCPFGGVIAVNGEAVDPVKGLEVVEVRSKVAGSECAGIADFDLSGVSKDALFAHVRKEAEYVVPWFTEGLLPRIFDEGNPVVS